MAANGAGGNLKELSRRSDEKKKKTEVGIIYGGANYQRGRKFQTTKNSKILEILKFLEILKSWKCSGNFLEILRHENVQRIVTSDKGLDLPLHVF